MSNMPRIPALTGKGAAPSISKDSVLDEIEDLLLEHVGDADIADEIAHDIGQILDQWGWDSG